MKKTLLAVGALLAAVGLLVGRSGNANATMDMQKQAKEIDIAWLRDYVEANK